MRKKNLKFGLVLCIFILTMFSFYYINSYAENTLTQYNIDVNFDNNTKMLTGSEDITYTNNYNTPLNDIVLHLYPDSYNKSSTLPAIGDTNSNLSPEQIGDITINDTLVNNSPINFSQDNQVLKFQLSTPLKSNEQITIHINFTVKIPLGTDRMGYTSDVFSVTYWYPIMSIYDVTTNTWDENKYNPIGESNYSDASNYVVTLHTPKNIVTATTGKVVNESISGDTKTLEINANKVRDFVFMMSKYYKVLEADVNGVKIKSYYIYDEKSKNTESAAKNILDIVSDSEKFYSKTFGKYPYPELDVVETYLTGGAMEYPALIQMGKYSPLPKNAKDDHSSWLENAAAHETGHQWWYVAVGNNEFKEPMMDESINTYCTSYYFEKRYGKYNGNGITMQFRQNLIGTSLPINSSVDKFANWDQYTTVIYSKGPEVFEDLRNRVGEEKFINILRTYFSRFEFKNGSIKDFMEVVGEIGGQNVKTVLENGINSQNYSPKNILINTEEKKSINNLNLKSTLEGHEATNGLTLSSMLLRGLSGQKIDFVIPSKLSASDSKGLLLYVNSIKATYEKSYNIKINILKDNAITNKQLSDDLIVLGTPNTNIVLKKLEPQLPVQVNSKSFTLKDNKIKTTNAAGIYIIKNPKDKNKMLMVIFWMNSFHKYDFINDNMYQYIVNYGKDNELRGQL
jgi:hypothetical protein